MGAWIEICDDVDEAALSYVAPLVGAWIEIHKFINESVCIFVAPLVGAWIEIFSKGYRYADFESLLSWERGLKC